MQRYLFELLYENKRPMTFAAIRSAAAGEDFVFRFTVERSLRRNLKRMVDSEVVVANGDRYCIHPKILAVMAEGGRVRSGLSGGTLISHGRFTSKSFYPTADKLR